MSMIVSPYKNDIITPKEIYGAKAILLLVFVFLLNNKINTHNMLAVKIEIMNASMLLINPNIKPDAAKSFISPIPNESFTNVFSNNIDALTITAPNNLSV
jgi:hypothetical protein